MAQAFYDTADESTRDWLANVLFYRELESIRRDKPLLDPGAYPVVSLKLYDRDHHRQQQQEQQQQEQQQQEQQQQEQQQQEQQQQKKKKEEEQEDETAATVGLRGGARPNVEFPFFKRRKLPLSPWFLTHRLSAKSATVRVLDDDDDDEKVQERPADVLLTTKLDIASIAVQIGYTKSFEKQFPLEVEAAQTTEHENWNHDNMFERADWMAYLPSYLGKVPVLYKGFPMVEDVVFVKHPNYWTRIKDHRKLVPNGSCYWTALALLLYGNSSLWLRVKAEHLGVLERILQNPRHPRHNFYARDNQVRTLTLATGPAGKRRVWSGLANLWERLQIPGCWVNEDVCHLTADVYGVFMVLYKYNSSNPAWQYKVYDLKTYGAYNNRHLFLCYSVGPCRPCCCYGYAD